MALMIASIRVQRGCAYRADKHIICRDERPALYIEYTIAEGEKEGEIMLDRIRRFGQEGPSLSIPFHYRPEQSKPTQMAIKPGAR